MAWIKHSIDSMSTSSRNFGELHAYTEKHDDDRWTGTITAFGRLMRTGFSGRSETAVKRTLTQELKKIADDIYEELGD